MQVQLSWVLSVLCFCMNTAIIFVETKPHLKWLCLDNEPSLTDSLNYWNYESKVCVMIILFIDDSR